MFEIILKEKTILECKDHFTNFNTFITFTGYHKEDSEAKKPKKLEKHNHRYEKIIHKK